MSELFGFDPKCLSDDQLFTKQVELTKRKILATRIGQADAANQLEILIQAIEYERRERMFLDRVKQIPTSPIVIETDPELREQAIAIEEAKSQKSTQPARSPRRAIRSATPILPLDGV
jgi:hypothetical protein